MNEGNGRPMTRLEELAYKYGTDKLKHGYIPFYEKYLPKEPKRILEIGVKEGKSLAMWAEYFPEAEIHGFDLFEENSGEDALDFIVSASNKNRRIELHKGHQCDYRILEELRKYEFDVIIDDGSHNARDQMMTFFGLFNGKRYFIEDLHCNFEEFYSQGLPELLRADNVFSDIKNSNKHIGFEGTPIHGFDGYEGSRIICIQTNL